MKTNSVNNKTLELEYIKQELVNYFSGLQVKKVCIFGSYAKGTQHEESDIDILVDIDTSQETRPNILRWHNDLVERFGVKVDFIIHRHNYNDGSFGFWKRIDRYMITVLEQ